MNSFGKRLIMTTFGESHGKAIGCVLDGVPAGLEIDETFIQNELDRRRPGKSKFATARKELDEVQILSGVFEGKSTGTPIAMVIFNKDQKSRDYSNIKDIFRPGHADFTYWHKYGIRDYRGGGRSSARETAARVAAGAVAKLLLKEFGIQVEAGVCEVAGIEAKEYDFDYAKTSEIFALDPHVETLQKEAILKAKELHDSVGGAVLVRATNLPVGFGEPIYYKLDAVLAEALMSINAAKAVDIGLGREASRLYGSQNNDQITKGGFISNNAGGILGGISNGEDVIAKVWFKPTPSIFQKQRSIDVNGNEVEVELKGRHDPFVAARGSVVAEAMMALVIADMLLLNATSQLSHLKKVYL
ncbi:MULTISPECIES: chorismate synthase [unclassified Nitratiruptor]|uniref:chorismate synthase n=1 Tax=unclassified Nitratiruptor TaxID=2624044 RepID=UPI0019160558|nr:MULTISPECIES: chorismate synthase [unclassified Nitratiruptor]BCD59475.1 chorismate synthase [Nitratiruptor sp. YY08-10]BCD63399.1 chorismate synthase [Nitratiruptor sp. YY08-14]